MCGIAGLIGSGPLPDDGESRVRDMLGAIRHRGPDQFGIFIGHRVALGSARLSIIDPAGGQQPMCSDDGRYWIVFNGEIFNYLELRPALERAGHRFRTHSDTEVLLKLFVEEGPACLQRLNGQFSLAIYDAHACELFLARDRFGVRPLFFTAHRGQWFFGSEIKCLLAGRRERAVVDPAGIGQVFTYWATLPGRTVFEGIHELPAGHWLRWCNGGVEVRRYWDCAFANSDGSAANEKKSVREWKEELKDRLLSATRLRLRADVPVGAYLSGGLDSSLITSVVRRCTTAPLRTFSIAFADERYDEREFQSRMADFLGTEHEVVEATHADIGRVFPDVIWHTETPVLRTAPAPMYLLSRRVRERGYKVVLTGEGADEFLGGYDIFKEAAVRRFWARCPDSTWRPRLLEKLYPDIVRSGVAGPGFWQSFFGHRLTDVEALDYSHAIRWRNTRRLWRFLSPEAAAVCGKDDPGQAIVPLLPDEYARWGPLQRGQYLEIRLFLSQYLLSSQGDRVAMANSVEGRHPFLDTRLVEWSNRLPERLKLRGLTEKVLLRAVGKDWLPPQIWQRTKRPYRAPIARSFFHSGAPAYVQEMLSESELRATGLFHPAAVNGLRQKAAAGRPLGETDEMALAGILSSQLVHHWFAGSGVMAGAIGGSDDVKVCREAGARYPFLRPGGGVEVAVSSA